MNATAKTVAQALSVSVSTVYRWLKTGEITKHGYTGTKVAGRWQITEAPTEAPSLEAAILTALTGQDRSGYVSLTKVRQRLGAWTRSQQDATLAAMLNDDKIRLEPDPIRYRLTAEDREAAIHIGGEDRHLVAAA